MQTLKTSLVIPVYSTTPESVQMMHDCLASLKYGRPDEVIVVDDGSPIQADYDCDTQIYQPQNRGYTEAVNLGLKEAKGEVIIIGNSDLTFQPGWLEGILLPLEEGCDVSSIVTSDQGYMTADKTTIGDRFGSLWAMKRSVYEALGGLDESLGRGYFSDTDYYLRLKEANYRVGKNWRALVEHEGGSTFKAVDPDNQSYHESMAKFKAKHGMVI
jgi:glycosyltransferase involved in cell wall biosynthesis